MSDDRQTSPQYFPVYGGPWHGRRVTFRAGDPPDGTPVALGGQLYIVRHGQLVVARPRDFKRNRGGT